MNSITPQFRSRANGASRAFVLSGNSTPAASRHIRSPLTRVIHLLLLIVVLHQLIGSEFIQFPFPGEPPSWTFSLHEYLGLVNLAIVAAFWAWTMARRGETCLGRLLPWFSIARMRDVIADLASQLRRLAQGQAPDDEDGALASAIHGLGLLAVTAVAATGALFFFTAGTHFAHTMLGLHKLLSNFVWIYLFAHAGVAVLHHLFGSNIFSRMFWPSALGRLAIRMRLPPSRGVPLQESDEEV